MEGALPDLHLSLSDKKLEQIAKVEMVVMIVSAMLLTIPQILLSLPPPPPVMEVDPNAVKIKGHDVIIML